jgi:hypothetical protein
MTQDEIRRMASKVDLSPVVHIYPRELENFVKLVEKNELERMREVFRVALLDTKKRKLVSLTNKEINQVIEMGLGVKDSIKVALDKLKEKNESKN